MTLTQAIKLLERYQKWRRGGKGKMPAPSEVGKALDVAINIMKGLKNKK